MKMQTEDKFCNGEHLYDELIWKFCRRLYSFVLVTNNYDISIYIGYFVLIQLTNSELISTYILRTCDSLTVIWTFWLY